MTEVHGVILKRQPPVGTWLLALVATRLPGLLLLAALSIVLAVRHHRRAKRLQAA